MARSFRERCCAGELTGRIFYQERQLNTELPEASTRAYGLSSWEKSSGLHPGLKTASS